MLTLISLRAVVDSVPAQSLNACYGTPEPQLVLERVRHVLLAVKAPTVRPFRETRLRDPDVPAVGQLAELGCLLLSGVKAWMGEIDISVVGIAVRGKLRRSSLRAGNLFPAFAEPLGLVVRSAPESKLSERAPDELIDVNESMLGMRKRICSGGGGGSITPPPPVMSRIVSSTIVCSVAGQNASMPRML